MGTYTTNYNLFMPTIGEQGWGDLVNGNFITIDTTMKGLDGRIETLESETDAIASTVNGFGSRITAIENEVNGALSCTSVTTTGNITVGGTINGKFGGTVSRIITVTPSSILMDGGYKIDGCLLPYNNGATYSGTVKGYVNNTNNGNALTFHFQVGTSITTTTITSTSASTATIPTNCVCAYVRGGITTSGRVYVYVPIFS